jgi:RNA polymerase sigma factor (TIGR02999 family)
LSNEHTPEPAVGAVTQWLRRWTEGDPQALDQLVPLVYDELRRLAARYLRHERAGHTLQSTGLVHEAFLRLSQASGARWESRAQFFGLASRLMRHILVDHARARQAGKRGGGHATLPLDEAEGAAPAASLDIVALDQALQRLERLDEQQSRVVELRFFGGLSIDETAASLQVSPATVKREWSSARAWLLRELNGPAAAPRQVGLP